MSNSTFDYSNISPVYNSSLSGIQSLQEIDSNSLSYDSDIASSTATNIYVERAAVKVELDFFSGVNSLPNASINKDITSRLPTVTFTSTGDKLVINGWTLTVTNNSYYPIKMITQATWNDWNTANRYQMTTHISSSDLCRSYWAVDPDYINGPTQSLMPGYFSDFTYAKYSDAEGKNAGTLAPQYCLENTFKAINQNQNQTTSVLVTGAYYLASNTDMHVEDIYTLNGMTYNASSLSTELAIILNLLLMVL